MNYETFTITDPFTNVENEYITLFIDKDNAKTFPADESNSDFIAFAEANPDWNKA